MAKHEDALRCMALGDEQYVKDVLAMQLTNVDASGLDPKTHALVRLGALIALDASQSSFQWNAATALASGATVDDTAMIEPDANVCSTPSRPSATSLTSSS